MANLKTEAQVAEQLNLSPLTLKGWRLQGRGPRSFKLPGKKQGSGYAVRYRQEDVDSWLKEISVEAVQREIDEPRTARRSRHRAG